MVVDDSRAIAIQQDNPKKAGSKSYARYEKYKCASSVAEFLKLGGASPACAPSP